MWELRQDDKSEEGYSIMMATEAIEFERREMVDRGWDIHHDVLAFKDGELAVAAQCYLSLARKQGQGVSIPDSALPRGWPTTMDASAWRPSGLAKVNILRAASLLAAEWDRLHATGA